MPPLRDQGNTGRQGRDRSRPYSGAPIHSSGLANSQRLPVLKYAP
jgi:hypothetical protein